MTRKVPYADARAAAVSIAADLKQLSARATEVGLPLTAYLVDLARLEAEREVQKERVSPPGASRYHGG